MRPQILFPLFKDLTRLPGIGPRTGPLLAKAAGGERVVDLLWHFPTGVVDRRFAPALAETPAGITVTLDVEVAEHMAPAGGRRSKQPYRIRTVDPHGGHATLDIVYFHGKADWLQATYPVGARITISGKVEFFNNHPQMMHPEQVVPSEQRESIAIIEPVYPLTAGLTPKTVTKAVTAALELAPELPDWLPTGLAERERWPDWLTSLQRLHAPDDPGEIRADTVARRRLAYDEVLANQLALLLVRERQRRRKGRIIRGDGRLRRAVETALPFDLTDPQRRALAEIESDMGKEERMLRLLQGDVGSGKTVVALLSMLNAVEDGAQAALLAPTEILARQHLETIGPLLLPLGITSVLLTGRDKGKERQQKLERIADGRAQIVVGTHALVQETVAFRDLALAVIDEQHRFGVHQRLALTDKGRGTDVLVMTATPIPRTLTLTAFGDMDVSRITGKPPGRKPVDTRTFTLERIDEVVAGIARQVASGAKAYWVCPLVEDDEDGKTDLAAATRRHAELQATLGPRVGLVHGRMKGEEKDQVMSAFAGDGLDILVATTVIEVGVNVPAATVMVVEHAERFGLAQLHQLRGRIGRGDAASTCLLLFDRNAGETARKRLKTLRETDDGFQIAEMDLTLRGAGDLLGTKQSGLPKFRIADWEVHGELLQMARDDAALHLATDPELQTPRGEALRVLLYLFDRDAAIRFLSSG